MMFASLSTLELLVPGALLICALLVAGIILLRRSRRATHAQSTPTAMTVPPRDSLTGMYNRPLFVELGQKTLELAQRNDRDLSLCLLELDGFKAFQDQHGGAAADELLEQTSARVQCVVRNADISARIAPGRLAILMAETDLDGAQVLVRRLQAQLRDTPFRVGTQRFRMTASFGLAGLAPHESELNALLTRAELTLVQARRLGRDRISIA